MGRLPPGMRSKLLLSLAVAALSCGPTRLEAVPPELIGLWAGQGRFDNNYLEIEAGSFTLGAGNLELGVYRIESIDTSSDPDHKKIYRLHHHADEGYPDALVLTYQTDPFPILRVGASPEPWTRAPSSP